MNILFVCSANIDRSKTAEIHFATKHPEHQFKSAGTNIELCLRSGSTPLSKELLHWADWVFAMEPKHQEFINSLIDCDVQVLDVPDDYKFMDRRLIDILEKKVDI